MSKSKYYAAIESIIGVVIGFLLSLVALELLYFAGPAIRMLIPSFKFEPNLSSNVVLTIFMTFISFLRSYYLRRYFIRKHKKAIREQEKTNGQETPEKPKRHSRKQEA